MQRGLTRLAFGTLVAGLLILAAPAKPGAADGNTGVYFVSSTAYSQGPLMANGQLVHDGAVACNFLPFGTRVRVMDGPLAGKVLTVEDRIGWGSDFDIWMASENDAIQYGRRNIQIQVIPEDPTLWAKEIIHDLLSQYGAHTRPR